MALELVANVWPVVDIGSGIVQRFFMRAYALDAPDEVISATLTALAPTDFRMAKVFGIPERFVISSQYGNLRGCVTIEDFHRRKPDILGPSLNVLENEYARLQGISISDAADAAAGIVVAPRFPQDPYLVVTSLIETAEGELIPQV